VFEVTGSYPQVSTCEVVEIIWAVFYVIVLVMFVVFLANLFASRHKHITSFQPDNRNYAMY